jgi:hypothetical protein
MRRLLACAAIVTFGLATVPANATPPTGTTIQIETALPPGGGAPGGPFMSTGGGTCSKGDTIDLFGHGAGSESSGRLQLLVLKRFTCADGSGTFDVLFRVHLVFDPFSDVGTWTVVGGTGAYERLHGTGKLSAVPTEGGVLDTLEGRFHVD